MRVSRDNQTQKSNLQTTNSKLESLMRFDRFDTRNLSQKKLPHMCEIIKLMEFHSHQKLRISCETNRCDKNALLPNTFVANGLRNFSFCEHVFYPRGDIWWHTFQNKLPLVLAITYFLSLLQFIFDQIKINIFY